MGFINYTQARTPPFLYDQLTNCNAIIIKCPTTAVINSNASHTHRTLFSAVLSGCAQQLYIILEIASGQWLVNFSPHLCAHTESDTESVLNARGIATRCCQRARLFDSRVPGQSPHVVLHVVRMHHMPDRQEAPNSGARAHTHTSSVRVFSRMVYASRSPMQRRAIQLNH